MLLATVEYVPGRELELLGIVKGTTVQSKHVGKDFMAGVKTLVGGEIEQMRLPADGTYDDNGSSIFIDEAANAQALREFIYG